jgi:hypothetical protein
VSDWDDTERQALEPLERELAELRERHHDDPPLDCLRAARAGVLPDDLQQKTAAHLESSAWSRALTDGADDADATFDHSAADRLLSRIQRETSSARGRADRHPLWAPVLVFVSIAAILVIAIGIWRSVAPAPQTPSTPAAQRPASSAPVVLALQLTKPDVKLTSAALLVRGSGGSRFVDDVAPGLNAYRAGDYASAARALEAVQPNYPRSVEIPFYLGVSRLFLNDAPAAVRALESARALNEPSFADDVAWYLAVAYERAGSGTQSRVLLERLCGGSSIYAARACAATGGRR